MTGLVKYTNYINIGIEALNFVFDAMDKQASINESEKHAYALREILRRLAKGGRCLKPDRKGGCATTSDFKVSGISPQQNDVFRVLMDIEGIDEELTVNFGLLDRGLSYGRVVLSGRSSEQLRSGNATEVYAWLIDVQQMVFINRGRKVSGSQPL